MYNITIDELQLQLHARLTLDNNPDIFSSRAHNTVVSCASVFSGILSSNVSQRHNDYTVIRESGPYNVRRWFTIS